MTPEASTLVSHVRIKMAQGLEIPIEEMVQVTKALRADRFSAAAASAVKGKARATKAAVLNINGDDLLDEMLS